MADLPRLTFDEIDEWPMVAEWTEILQVNAMRIREQRIQALLLPKPWWMPKLTWYWLVRQMIVIVELPAESVTPDK